MLCKLKSKVLQDEIKNNDKLMTAREKERNIRDVV